MSSVGAFDRICFLVLVLGALVAAQLGAPRDPRLWPFAPTSPWNTPIGTNAQFGTTSNPMYLDAVIGTASISNTANPLFFNAPSDPLCEVIDISGSYLGQFIQVPIPLNATPSNSGPDMDLTIMDYRLSWAIEGWQSVRQPGPMCNFSTSDWYNNSLLDDGWGPRGLRQAAVACFAGLIRGWELDAGTIPHALTASGGTSQLCGNATTCPNGTFVWPAPYGGRPTYVGHIPVGQLFAIPPSTDLLSVGLNPAALVVAQALQNYGLYFADHSLDRVGIFADNYCNGTKVAQIAAQLSTVVALLRPVLNNAPSSVGGGGTPRMPPAPSVGQVWSYSAPTAPPTGIAPPTGVALPTSSNVPPSSGVAASITTPPPTLTMPSGASIADIAVGAVVLTLMVCAF